LIEHSKLDRFFTKIMVFFKGQDPDRRRSAPSLPENPTPLQIFKEHMLADIGGAAKSVSYINRFYRLLPVRAFSSAVRPPGGDQTGPNRTEF
jgi:hypothetical protein